MVIRMISGGFGLVSQDAGGAPRFTLKTPQSGWFEAPDDKAEELVKAGRAVAKTAAAPAALQEAEAEAETVDEEDGPDLSVSDVVPAEPVPEKPVKKRSRRKKD